MAATNFFPGGKVKEIVKLNGLWKLYAVKRFSDIYRSLDFDDNRWHELNIPGQWQGHPHFKKYQGKMVYRKVFSFEVNPDSVYEIQFDGVFYYAAAYLNGKHLGCHEGYFSLPKNTGGQRYQHISTPGADAHARANPCLRR